MTSINDEWLYRGTSLHGTNWNIRMLSPTEQVPARRGQNVAVPGLDGTIYRAKPVDERIISLAMFVKGTEGSALATDLDTLRSIFGQPGQGLLQRKLTGRAGTYSVYAEVANLVEFTPASHQFYNAVVEFRCADPFWTGPTYQVESLGITSSPHTFTIQNNGTVANERMVIWIAGDITNPMLTVGDYWLQHTGTVVAGNTLEINCDEFTAAYGGGGVSGNISHGGGLRWMRYLPGANTATLTGSGLGTVSITTEFKELYL